MEVLRGVSGVQRGHVGRGRAQGWLAPRVYPWLRRVMHLSEGNKFFHSVMATLQSQGWVWVLHLTWWHHGIWALLLARFRIKDGARSDLI